MHVPPLSLRREDRLAVIENPFVRWVHDPDRGGELVEATVLHGSGENLLAAPQSTSVGTWVRGGWRSYHRYETAAAPASRFEASQAPDGCVRLSYASTLIDAEGRTLPGISVEHTVEYRPSGVARHAVALVLSAPADLGQVQIGSLAIRNHMTRLAVRPCAIGQRAAEFQHPCDWIELRPGKTRRDLPAWRSRLLPLSVLLFRPGLEAIEMSMGDDLGAWDGFGRPEPGFQQGAVFEEPREGLFRVIFAPLDSPRAGNVVPAGRHVFAFNLALPFVRDRILPLRIGSGALKPRSAAPFEQRWPSTEEVRGLARAGVSILRVHDDGDTSKRGIFWRDATSDPPYPPDELAKMQRFLADARDAEIDAVPYFSVKEYHPESAGFAEHAEEFARVVLPGERYVENSIFGMQMCLESGWEETRRRTIAQTLDTYAFRGAYYDWTMGLECSHLGHMGGHRHWDGDRVVDLIEWTRARIGPDQSLYLHLTNTPNLAAENLGDLILVEESEYWELFPEMFTPQVHFLNTAPRSICMMLGKEATPAKLRRLSAAALLHHATICSTSPDVLGFYAEHRALLDRLPSYVRHAAPGEGVAETGSRAVGMSLYWRPAAAGGWEGLALLANLGDRDETASWTVRLGGASLHGETPVPAGALVPLELRSGA